MNTSSIVNSITIDAPPERVWRALTASEELNGWETVEAHLDLRSGGDFLYVYAYGPPRPGTFLVVDPPHRMVQLNLVFDGDRSFRYVNTNTLTAVTDGTRVHVLVEGFGDSDVEQWLRESMDLGWETDLEILKAYVEDGIDLRSELWRGLLLGVCYLSVVPGRPGNGSATHGVRLLEVFPDQPAARAGLEVGDVITALDGQRISDFRGFRRLLAPHRIGDTATLDVLRDDVPSRVAITFGDARPAADGREDEDGEATESGEVTVGAGTSG